MGAMKDFLMRWLVLTVAAAVMVVLLPGMTAVGSLRFWESQCSRCSWR